MQSLNITEEDLQDECFIQTEFFHAVRSNDATAMMAITNQFHSILASGQPSPLPLFFEVSPAPPKGWPRVVSIQSSGFPIHYACFFGLYDAVLSIVTADPSEALNPSGEILFATSAGGGPVTATPIAFLRFRLDRNYFAEPPQLGSFARIERLLKLLTPPVQILNEPSESPLLQKARYQMFTEISLFDLVFESLFLVSPSLL